MTSLLVKGLSGLVTGDRARPLESTTSIYCEDGVIREMRTTRNTADTVVDARGLLAVPGLVDTHFHPTFGDFHPAQNSVGWVSAYLHGGSTTLISAGESQVQGFPLNPPDPLLCKYLAILIKRCWQNLGLKAPRLTAGTLLLVPGLKEADFDEVAQQGVRCAKFLFYPYERNIQEARAYARSCRERGIIVKLHSGGVSGSGFNFPAGWQVIKEVLPDVVAHINGGPIPMPQKDMEAIVKDSKCYLEVCLQGSLRRMVELIEIVVKEGAEDRVIIGSDTPSPSGVIPRLMWRTVAALASLTAIPPEVAISMASGNGAKAHGLEVGILQEGRPADLLLVGTVEGSSGANVLDGLRQGEIPGLSCVIVGGEIVVEGRSRITPPPKTLAAIEKRA